MTWNAKNIALSHFPAVSCNNGHFGVPFPNQCDTAPLTHTRWILFLRQDTRATTSNHRGQSATCQEIIRRRDINGREDGISILPDASLTMQKSIPNVGSSPVQISFRKGVATNIKLGQGLQITSKCHFIPWHSMQILIVEPETSSSIIIEWMIPHTVCS
jgi:hypothetical protein